MLVIGKNRQLTESDHRMLTSAQVRAELRIGRDKLRELIDGGELEAYKTGTAPNSHYRITEASLAAYKERVKVVPAKVAV